MLRCCLLTKRAIDLIRERLHQIRHHRAVAGLHKGFDRHSWHKLDIAEPRDLLSRHRDPDRVVALAGALVGRDIRRNLADAAKNFRRCPAY